MEKMNLTRTNSRRPLDKLAPEKKETLNAIIFFFLLFFLLFSIMISSARASSSRKINASINLNDSGSGDIQMVWEGEAPENLKINGSSWSMSLSSPNSGKLKSDLTVSATFSEQGIQWLSEQGIKSKLSIADGYPDTIEELVLNDWEGKKISSINWANVILGVMPEAIGDQIAKLTIEGVDCKKFQWDEPTLDIRLILSLTGGIVNNQDSVGDPSVSLTGNLSLSKPNWTRTVNADFQVPSTDGEWKWNFAVPHLQTIYGSSEYEGLKQSFSNREAKLTLNSIEKAELTNVPEEYEKTNLTYIWTNGNAADGIAALLTGGANYSIKYSETESSSSPPNAESGGPYTVSEGETVNLNGTGSSDPDGSIVSYNWEIVSGPGSLTDTNTATPTFHAPNVTSDTEITVQLTVKDNGGNTDTNSGTITVLALSQDNTLENLENISPEKAAELLIESPFGNAAEAIENISSDTAGKILEASVEMKLTDNVVKLLNYVDPSKTAEMIQACNFSISVDITKAMIRENIERASKIVDRGAKMELERQSQIVAQLSTENAAELLLNIFDLPESPETAADILETLDSEKSTKIVSLLIDTEKIEQLTTMFSNLSDEKINEIYRALTEEERGSIYHNFSTNLKSKISTDLAPNFETENLEISKTELTPGGINSFFIVVTNKGGTPGTSLIELKINGTMEDNQKIYLNAGETETITFQTSENKIGEYEVQIGDQSGKFQVVQKEGVIDHFIGYLKRFWIPILVSGIILTGAIVIFFIWPRPLFKAFKK